MNVDLLCPGGSLLLYRSTGAIRIAVNRAAMIANLPVQWQVCGDLRALLAFDSHPSDGYCLKGRTVCDTELRGPFVHAWETFEDLAAWSGIPYVDAFSATIALVLAAKLGATHIDAWGCDREGTADADGVTTEWGNGITDADWRYPERWRREGLIWDATVAWLKSRSVTVERHLCHPEPSQTATAAPSA